MKPLLPSLVTIGLVVGILTTVRAEDRGLVVIRAAQDSGLVDYSPRRFHALVIGIDRYANWVPLNCAVADARAMADTLRRNYGYEDVRLLINDDATRERILDELDRCLTFGEDDSLLVFYAGHGWMDEARNGYWIPVDARQDRKSDYLSNSQIVGDYFRKYKVRHLLVVADSCFSGAMLRGGDTTRPPDWKLPAGFQKPSRWVLTSGDLTPVEDDAGTGHSPFATRLLQYMKGSDASAYGLLDLYVYVRQNLKSSPICRELDTVAHMPGGEYVFCRLDAPLDMRTPPVVVSSAPAPIARPVVSKLPPGQSFSVDLGGGVRMDFEYVSPGQFSMGSNEGDEDERPAHSMRVDRGFWIGRTEVTEGQWQKLMGMSVSGGIADSLKPVEGVSWNDAQAFCKKLNETGMAGGLKCRLPTEAEWEYACRGGTTGRFFFEGGVPTLGRYAWYGKNAHGGGQPVGQLEANPKGLRDMLGNVWEWCEDWYAAYPGAENANSFMGQQARVLRGGSYANNSSMISCSGRSGAAPDDRSKGVGFRVVFSDK